jgi:hypothetical protein
MAHFYGTLKGQAGEATRRGSKGSGLKVAAASWNGAVYVRLWHKAGEDTTPSSSAHGRAMVERA